MHTASNKPTNARRPVQSLDARRVIVPQSESQEGNEDQIKSLALDSVQKSKVLTNGLVESPDRTPPQELVHTQEQSKDHHVDRQKGCRIIVKLGRTKVNEREDTEGRHKTCQTQIEEGEEDEKGGTALLAAAAAALVVASVTVSFSSFLRSFAYLAALVGAEVTFGVTVVVTLDVSPGVAQSGSPYGAMVDLCWIVHRARCPLLL